MTKYSRVYIEITNVCNLSCSFCIGNARKARFMSSDEFAHVIQQVKPYTNHVYLHVLGEPLLHPELESFLAIANSFGISVNITTNGTLLTKAQSLLLTAPALRKISISLHSMEPHSPYSPDEYLQNVVAFVLAATQKGIICELRMWNLGSDDNDNMATLATLYKLLNLSSHTKALATKHICESGSTMLAPKLFLGKAQRFTWPSMDAPLTNQPIFCHGLRNQLAVLSNGTVVPCCLDSNGDIALGNVFNTPLTEILSSNRAKALYNGFSARNPSEELCRRCGYAQRF